MSNLLYVGGAIAAAIFLLGRKSVGDGGTNLSVPFFNPDVAGGYAGPEAGVQTENPQIQMFSPEKKTMSYGSGSSDVVSYDASRNLISRIFQTDQGVFQQLRSGGDSPSAVVNQRPGEVGIIRPGEVIQLPVSTKKAEAPTITQWGSTYTSTQQGGAIVYTQSSKKASNNFTGTAGRTYRG